MSELKEMSPAEFAARARDPNPPLLLDVREDWELALARLDGVHHIPMGQVPDRLAELPRDGDIVVMCRSGGRSTVVGKFLIQQGYPRVWNLTGGILAWSEEVDPSLPSY